MRNNTTKKIINLEGKVIVKGYFNGISIIEIRTTDEIAYSGAEVAYSQAHKVAVSDIKPKNVQLCRNFMVFEAGFRDKPKTPHPTLDKYKGILGVIGKFQIDTILCTLKVLAQNIV